MASDRSIEVDSVFKDFSDDLGFLVTQSLGTGVAKTFNLLSPMATQPGGISEGQSLPSRSFRILGSIIAEGGEDKTDVHDKRQALAKAINSYRSSVSSGLPTRRLRYSGATVTKDIYALFDGGLDDEPPVGWAEEDLAIRFLAPDPLFYATSETTTALDSNDTATVRSWLGRESGQWSVFDAPTVATTSRIYAIVSDDTYIYIGGQFTNWDGDASSDYIVRMNRSTGVYTPLASGLNNDVNDMAVDSNGDLIVVGNFTNAGGDANADYIARWNGTAFSAIGVPNITAEVKAVKIAPNGDIYFGGAFLNLGSDANADRVGYWDLSASAYAAMSTGVDGVVNSLAIDGASNVYVGGDFNNAGGSAAAKIVMWDGSAFQTLGSGMPTNGVDTIAIDKSGVVYMGGTWATAGGVTVNNVTAWNGTTFTALGDGTDLIVSTLSILENGSLFAGGGFTTAGDLTGLTFSGAMWNGSQWTMLNVDISGSTPSMRASHAIGNDLYIGGELVTGTAIYAGKTTIEYNGTATAYAKITINRSGGTFARVKNIINQETTAILYMNYNLLDGETLTIEGRPQEGISVTSSMFGAVPSAILSGSNLSQFFLTPGNGSGNNDNEIYTYVDTTGSPTITANIIYKSAYISLD